MVNNSYKKSPPSEKVSPGKLFGQLIQHLLDSCLLYSSL